MEISTRAKESQRICDDNEGRAGIGKDSEPEAGMPEQGKDEKKGFYAKGEDNVKTNDAERPASKAYRFGNHHEVVPHQGDVSGLDGGVCPCGTHGDADVGGG